MLLEIIFSAVNGLEFYPGDEHSCASDLYADVRYFCPVLTVWNLPVFIHKIRSSATQYLFLITHILNTNYFPL